MMEEFVSCDVAKEFLMVLAYCDSNFVNNIPDYIMKKMNDLAADSLKEVYIDKNKTLMEQDISNECRELIGMIYFTYAIDSDAKKDLLNTLLENVDNING